MAEWRMAAAIGDSYDAVAELYASLFLDDLRRDPTGRSHLAAFATAALTRTRPVADLGCGPGHVVDHLTRLGLDVVGYDISAGQIAEARHAFPDGRFEVGDIASLGVDDASFGGIVSRYSIIHFPVADLDDVFAEWLRLLEPGAPVLLSFFGARCVEEHAAPFDHQVATAYAWFPATVAELLTEAGFVDAWTDAQPPLPDSGRPFDRATVGARSPSA